MNGRRGRKRYRRFLSALALLSALCALTACQKEAPAFAPDEAAIAAALEQAGLPGAISAEETMTGAAGNTIYVVRDPSETCGDSENPALVASVTGGVFEGERLLSVTFDQSVASEQIDWADWKRRLVLAAALYGDLADNEEICRAFGAEEVPAGQDRCQWDAQLSNAYCVIKWSHRSNKTYDAAQFETREHHATMWVTVCASRAQYEKYTADRQKTAGS